MTRGFATLFVLCLIFTPLVTGGAEMTVYPPQKIRSRGIQKLQISGVRGKLKLRARGGKYFTIQVRHSKGKRSEDWHLSVDRQGDALVFEVFNVAYGAQWRTLVREENWPEFDIEVSGPSIPAVLAWRDGRLEFSGWTSDIEASFLKGTVKAHGMRAGLTLQAVDAGVEVRDHKGALHLKGEKGQLTISDVQGRVDVNWLKGVVRARHVNGKVTLESLDAEWTIEKPEGQWTATLNSGLAKIDGLNGKMKASGVSAQWTFALLPQSDVEILSETGAVNVGGLNEAAKIFFSSRSGKMTLPGVLKAENREGIHVYERAAKAKPEAQVFVRTQSGAITWR